MCKISKDFALYKYMLDTAWNYNNDISIDEKNLLDALRKYLSITIKEQHILEAKSGRFPQLENAFYNQRASRYLKNLRANNIISKDLQCEHLFEDATNYIFEKMLLNNVC